MCARPRGGRVPDGAACAPFKQWARLSHEKTVVCTGLVPAESGTKNENPSHGPNGEPQPWAKWYGQRLCCLCL